MAITYEKFTTYTGVEIIKGFLDNGTVLNIPEDASNSDYQAYLRWLENPDAEEGGTL